MISKLITSAKSKISKADAIIRAFLASFSLTIRQADYRGMLLKVKIFFIDVIRVIRTADYGAMALFVKSSSIRAGIAAKVFLVKAANHTKLFVIKAAHIIRTTDYRAQAHSFVIASKSICSKAVYNLELVRNKMLSLEKRTLVALSSLTAGGTIAIVFAIVFVGSQVIGVQVNGKMIGYVTSEAEYASLVEEAKNTLSADNSNTEIIIEDNKVELSTEHVSKPKDAEKVDDEVFIEALTESGAIKANAYVITIDGKSVTTVATKKDANGIIKSIAEKFSTDGSKGKFQESIGIECTDTNLDELIDPASAIELLLTGGVEEQVYEVVKGDTVSEISYKFAISQDEIKAANPNLNLEKILIGDKIKITTLDPYVHYETTQIATVRVPIPFETVEQNTDSLYVGQKKTVSDGVNGEREVVQNEVRINGELKEATEISSVTIAEPVSKVVNVGTKKKVSYNSGGSYNGAVVPGSGRLSRPIGHWEISSGYGGGRGHRGLDLRAPKGTPIYAADGGTVTFAGWSSSFGNTVKINHGGGLETLYAHCDFITVAPGQTVSAGQQIAGVGITGNATGYHLHFEVRVNGSAVNPLAWL